MSLRHLSPNRELCKLIKAALAEGWRVDKRTNGHLKWTAPDGRVVFTASTPSDFRAIRNIKRELKLEVYSKPAR